MRTCFDFDWKAIREDVAGAQDIAFDDSQWVAVDLPHDFSIEGPIDENNPSGRSTGFYPGGVGWYRKTFTLPKEAAGKSVSIDFDGVYWNSDVWINGHHLGRRPNGYIGFRYDLSAHLDFDGPNVVAVRADNSEEPNARWYTGTGVYRHTWLNILDKVHVAHWGTYVTTPEVSEESATVRIRASVENQSGQNRAITLASAIVDGEGVALARTETSGDAPANGQADFDQEMKIDSPRLWSVEIPYLYAVVTTVEADGKTLDEYRTPFGVRYFAFDANTGFSLNGKRVKLQGVNLHHDGGCVGAAVPDRVLERRLEILKQMGCNAIRTAHNPHSPELLGLCDRMGLLVMDEIFDEWSKGKREFSYARFFKAWGQRDLADQVLRDRNHPCVVLWSIGNEIPGRIEEQGAAMARMLVDAIHELEPTRPVTCGCNNIQGCNKSGFAQALDVVGYNGGGGSVFVYREDHETWPERKMYASEVPHTFGTRGVYRTHSRHRNESGMAWAKMKTQEVPHLTEEEVFPDFDDAYHSSYDNAYVRICARDSWRLIEENEFMAGEFRWTGIDYLGESHAWPARSSNAGVIDLCGFPKDTYYFYQSRWTSAPMLHILPHWTWPNIKEGTIIPVWAYSNCDSVELFLNGESLGEKEVGDNFNLSWDVPYQSGAIKAIARKNGEILCVEEHRTAGPPDRIELTPDRPSINADGRDVVHLTVRVLDQDGHFVPTANNRITFEVEGAGRLIGVDNGDPIDHDSAKANARRAFAGLCLAIVQSTRRPGQIRIHATSPGLAPATIQLPSRLPLLV